MVGPCPGLNSYSSGVYTTSWIPPEDPWPPTTLAQKEDLQRMVGFWDRHEEQVLFEMDFAPFTDKRDLTPTGSRNPYRRYLTRPAGKEETVNYNNPCRFVTDLYQALNWIPKDWCNPNDPTDCEGTSGDHRRTAQRRWGDVPGYSRWSAYHTYQWAWQRPVHEHGPASSNSYTTPLFFKMACKQTYDSRCVLISDPSTLDPGTLGAGAKACLHTPKAVTYHEQ